MITPFVEGPVTLICLPPRPDATGPGLVVRLSNHGYQLEIFYTNLEGEAINLIYTVDGLVTNPAGFTYAGFLILNMNLYVRDVSSWATIAAMSAGSGKLVRNRLLAPGYGLQLDWQGIIPMPGLLRHLNDPPLARLRYLCTVPVIRCTVSVIRTSASHVPRLGADATTAFRVPESRDGPTADRCDANISFRGARRADSALWRAIDITRLCSPFDGKCRRPDEIQKLRKNLRCAPAAFNYRHYSQLNQ